MKKFLSNIFFVLQVGYIFFSECFKFRFHNSHPKFAENLMARLSQVNILCVKIFQAIALNNNWISKETNEKLLEFTDNAPWTCDDIDFVLLNKVIEEEDLKLLNKNEPINAGMISIVFQAVKGKEGKVVAVKMKRKDIDKKLEVAIERFKFVLSLLSFIPIFKMYEIPNSLRENIDILKDQTNFSQEVENMILFKNNCARLPYLVIPHVYADVTKRHENIIITEFLHGKKIHEITQESRIEYAKMFNKFVFISLFVHGVSHGDMHSGNILFLKDSTTNKKTIGLIDFGVIYRLTPDFRESLFDFCTGIFAGEMPHFAEQILDGDFFSPKGIMKSLPTKERNHIISLLSFFINNIREKTMDPHQINIYNFFYDLNTLAKENNLSQYGIKLSNDFIKLQMYIAMSQGVTMELAGNDYMDIANEVVKTLYRNTICLFHEK
jgi:predicted unusual protein kinase regulating ubiquinone biosynthesis (AarF/ABC1/UbiB family)